MDKGRHLFSLYGLNLLNVITSILISNQEQTVKLIKCQIFVPACLTQQCCSFKFCFLFGNVSCVLRLMPMKKIKGVHRILFPENPQSKGRMVVSLKPRRHELHHISDKLHPLKKWTKRRNKTSSDPPLKVTARLAEHLEDLKSKEGSLTLRTTCISSRSLW